MMGVILSWWGVPGGHPAEGGAQPSGEQLEDLWCRCGEAMGEGQGSAAEVHAGGEAAGRARGQEEGVDGGMVSSCTG